MDRQNSTEVIVTRAVELTVGKESGAWVRWWERASLDVEGIGIALYAALLSLGAPPAPEHLTLDLTNIELSSLPPKHINVTDERLQDEWEQHRRRAEERLDRRWRQQHPYNLQLNAWVRKHNLVYRHRTQDPAQFRKLFAGFLHACKRRATMKVMDGWFLNWIGDLLHKLPDQSHQFEWHEWYAWRPVRVHHYHHTGQFPIGETVGWAWLEPVWRRRKLVNMATELKTYYVIKRYQ